jgi:O-antigen/teichoic acid export membrane protein
MSATVGHARSSPGPARGLGRAALLVVPALFAGNLVSYLFTVVVARQLGPAAYGALGGLLAIVIALAVPGMALQLVVARNVAVCRRDGVAAGSLQAAVIRLGLRAGVALAVPALAAAPLLSGYLHLGSPGPPAWLAVNLALLPLLFAVSGLLQGRERFGVLTAVLLLVAAGKLPLGVALVAAGYGVEGALAGVAVGTLAAVLLGVAACGRARHRPGPAAADPEGSGEPRRGAPVGREGSGGPRGGAPQDRVAGLGPELTAAALGVVGLVAITNLDVLLARHYLPEAASGLYAAGSVVAKVTYWAPLAGVMVVFPRLAAGAGRRTLLRQAALATLAFGALCTAASALLALWPALLPFGRAYAAVGPDLPLFAALGTAFAMVQLLLFSDIAAGGRRSAWPVGVAAAGQALLVAGPFHHSVTQIVTVALASATLLLLAGVRSSATAAAVTERAG